MTYRGIGIDLDPCLSPVPIAGDDLDRSVRGELAWADVILLQGSPDFIASDYCYSVKMIRALERHERREAWVAFSGAV